MLLKLGIENNTVKTDCVNGLLLGVANSKIHFFYYKPVNYKNL